MLSQARAAFSAVLGRSADGGLCSAALGPGIDAQALGGRRRACVRFPNLAPWKGSVDLSAARYGQASIGVSPLPLRPCTENPRRREARTTEACCCWSRQRSLERAMLDLGSSSKGMDIAPSRLAEEGGVVANRGDPPGIGCRTDSALPGSWTAGTPPAAAGPSAPMRPGSPRPGASTSCRTFQRAA